MIKLQLAGINVCRDNVVVPMVDMTSGATGASFSTSWIRVGQSIPPAWSTHGTLDSLFSATALLACACLLTISARQNSSFPHKNVCRTAPRAFHPPTSRREANTSYSLVSLVSIVFTSNAQPFCCTFPSLPVPGVVSESGKVGQPDPHVYPRYCGFSTYARLPSVHEVRCENKIWNVQVAESPPKKCLFCGEPERNYLSPLLAT